MFVAFKGIEQPNSLIEEEAQRLHSELLSGIPSITQTQAALKIQQGWEQVGDVELKDDEKRVVVQILNRWSGPGEQTTENLRWLQQNMRRSLGEDVH
jgi:hypothetical protein